MVSRRVELDLWGRGGHDVVVRSRGGRLVMGYGLLFLASVVGAGCGDSSSSGGEFDASSGAIDAGSDGSALADDAGGCLASDASYVACGCGCCPGEPAVQVCLGPGQTLESVEEADRAAAMSPGCPMTGCSIPQEYSCCVSGSAGR